MTNGLRVTLWILSSLALLWTVIAVIGLVTAGCCGMPGGGMMASGGMMRGMPDGGLPGGAWMMSGMILELVLTWGVMLGLVGVFVYLIATARR